jgi:hypothetical protein
MSMRLIRTVPAALTLICLALAGPAAAAQKRPAPPATQAAEAAPAGSPATMTADETKRELEEILKQYPPALPRILRLDPSLLGNPGYLQPYPALTAFLAQHPEIGHNPGYFLAEYEDGRFGRVERNQTSQERAVEMWREAIQGITIGTVMLAIGSGIIWLIKTMIEYRRWSRLSRIQTDVHNKLLDRFTSNQELLAYIETPAGKRFLESAPIPVDSPRAISAPLGRILWSAQAGAVLTVLGIGIEIVAARALEEIASPVAAFGAVVIALGIGFIVSAFLAYMLTRRFGLLNGPNATPEIRG